MTSSTPSRRLIILGSTGSIGASTLEVARHLADSGALGIAVVGLSAGRNADRLIDQARAFNVPALAVADETAARKVRHALPHVQLFTGAEAARQLVEHACDPQSPACACGTATDLTAAIVGSAGLPATLAGVTHGLRIGLANKETLVAAGALVTPLVRRHHAVLIPIDSEHSAIFQCLHGQGRGPGAKGQADSGQAARWPSAQAGDKTACASSNAPRAGPLGHPAAGPLSCVRRIVLTASGGPFRNVPRERMHNATVEEALAHPTWKMGAKITIDSATMMNKALEIIEAHWLFDLPPEKIAVIIHPQSVAHSFVEFEDNSVLAQLGPPDMRTPIQYALTWPDRPAGCSRAMDWTTLSRLDFQQPDLDKFPALSLAYDVIDAGGTAGAIFNAANEEAVAAFLDRRIRLGRIVELVAEALSAIATEPADRLETILQADCQARQFVAQRVEEQSASRADR